MIEANGIVLDRLLIVGFGCGLALSIFGLLASPTITLAGESLALVALIALVLRDPAPLSGTAIVVALATYILILIYLIDAMGDNFVGTYPFLLGVRKSLPGWLFLLAGLLLNERLRIVVVKIAARFLLAGAAASLVLHLALPEIESSITRAADEYTALLDGTVRLQGVFAGPFHAALAGSALVLFGIFSPREVFGRRFRVLALGVGSVVVTYAAVRTAVPALLAAFAAATLAAAIRPSQRRWLAISAVSVVLALAAGIAIHGAPLDRAGEVAGGARQWSADSRLQNRVQGYRLSYSLINERPLTGWGAGSAGDTLDRYYDNGRTHVTAHNLALKYAVEAGLVGMTLVLIALVAVGVSLVRTAARDPLAPLGLGLVVILAVFGVTGTAIDAVPVSWLVLLVVGAATRPAAAREGAQSRQSSLDPHATAPRALPPKPLEAQCVSP